MTMQRRNLFQMKIHFFLFPLSEHIAEDDSDMLMEPSDFRPSVLASHPTYYQRANYQPYQNQFGSIERSSDDVVDPQPQAAQNFLPFFRDVQPLGHSRPYYTQESHRFASNRQYDQSILGSGDFGVIRGGTFYQDNDPPIRGLESNDYYSFYKNNGHGHGPQAAPYTQAKYNSFGDDQFSNFRDFADINTPTDPAYSHFVVVYANKNSTTSNHPNPKNIFEQLQLLDEEKAQEKQKKSSISKMKKKLALTKLEKKYKKKLGPKEGGEFEPLLALS